MSFFNSDKSKIIRRAIKQEGISLEEQSQHAQNKEEKTFSTTNIEDVFSWIEKTLSNFSQKLISLDLENSLLKDAINSGIEEEIFQREFNRYLDKKNKFSEKQLYEIGFSMLDISPDNADSEFQLIPANKCRNLFNKVCRAFDKEVDSKVWLDAFMKKYCVINEKDAKEKLYDWLENTTIIQKIKKKKSYTQAERSELDTLCPAFDFVQSSIGKQRKNEWIDRWLSDNGFTENKGGFFSRLFGL